MNEYIDIAREKKNQAVAAIVNKENQIIKDAMEKHFGNDDFEMNAGKCTSFTDPKTGIRKVIHDGTVLCEFHPIQVSYDGDYRVEVSFNYGMVN
ncbi:TPA: hypothetical protein ACXP7I_003219 [Klebsiella variicola subsp. variicola]